MSICLYVNDVKDPEKWLKKCQVCVCGGGGCACVHVCACLCVRVYLRAHVCATRRKKWYFIFYSENQTISKLFFFHRTYFCNKLQFQM